MPLWFVFIFVGLYTVSSLTCSWWCWTKIHVTENISDRGMFKLTWISCLLGGVFGAAVALLSLLKSLDLI